MVRLERLEGRGICERVGVAVGVLVPLLGVAGRGSLLWWQPPLTILGPNDDRGEAYEAVDGLSTCGLP